MSEWIACSERLPPVNTPVLVYGIDDQNKPMIAVYQLTSISDGKLTFWHSIGDCGYEHEDSIDEPLYWQPLPPPPV